jgi:hypothetical protein
VSEVSGLLTEITGGLLEWSGTQRYAGMEVRLTLRREERREEKRRGEERREKRGEERRGEEKRREEKRRE